MQQIKFSVWCMVWPWCSLLQAEFILKILIRIIGNRKIIRNLPHFWKKSQDYCSKVSVAISFAIHTEKQRSNILHNFSFKWLPKRLSFFAPTCFKRVSCSFKGVLEINAAGKLIHPKYYKHLKKGAHQSHLGRQKMGWFLAD